MFFFPIHSTKIFRRFFKYSNQISLDRPNMKGKVPSPASLTDIFEPHFQQQIGRSKIITEVYDKVLDQLQQRIQTGQHSLDGDIFAFSARVDSPTITAAEKDIIIPAVKEAYEAAGWTVNEISGHLPGIWDKRYFFSVELRVLIPGTFKEAGQLFKEGLGSRSK
ncbi:hypothetical protein HDV00_008100 [Rhizophlyctis rosea]|nr:hypothetical protein HDV00_008100 [Rhizophlyctis rosea]